MSATDELRRLLDERGVEWEDCGNGATYVEHNGEAWRFDYDELFDQLAIVCLSGYTPEQAIAATLGDADATGARQGDAGTCHDTHEARWFRCSACGFGIEDMYVSDEDEYPPEDQPKHCPNCGRKVVSE